LRRPTVKNFKFQKSIFTVPTVRFQTGSRNNTVSHTHIEKWLCRP